MKSIQKLVPDRPLTFQRVHSPDYIPMVSLGYALMDDIFLNRTPPSIDPKIERRMDALSCPLFNVPLLYTLEKHNQYSMKQWRTYLYRHAPETMEDSFWWFITPENVCVVCDSPEQLHVVDTHTRSYLHCENGPAISWPDKDSEHPGYKAFYIDGFKVDEQIVLRPDTQTVEQIKGESNNDLRAIRLARYGMARYLLETGANVIDETHNAIENTHEALLRDDNGRHYLWATCPSGRLCPPLAVPRGISKCEDARIWLSGKEKPRIIGRT